MQRFSHKVSSVLEKKIFKGFYYIWAWRPSWSTDHDYFSNRLFPKSKEAPYEIWAKLALGFRGEVVWIYERADDGRKVITIAHPARDTPNGSPLYSCQISSKYQSFGAYKDASQNSTSGEIPTYEESEICLSWTQHDYWSSSSSLPNIIKLSQTVME